jgi:hypothetical protein
MAKKKAPVNKYNNKKVVVDGIKFDSKNESEYYLHLKKMKEKGLIKDFSLQPEYILQEGFTKRGAKILPIKYRADFEVLTNSGEIVTVDVKGMETADFKLKAKMFEKRYPQELFLVTYSKIDGGWISLPDLKVARKKRKKEKEAKEGKKK